MPGQSTRIAFAANRPLGWTDPLRGGLPETPRLPTGLVPGFSLGELDLDAWVPTDLPGFDWNPRPLRRVRWRHWDPAWDNREDPLPPEAMKPWVGRHKARLRVGPCNADPQSETTLLPPLVRPPI